MNANKYQELAARTLIDKPDFQISDENMMIVWNAVGLAGEAGEVADLVKKGIFHQHGLDNRKIFTELGDVLWYVAALCTKMGFCMDDIMQANIDKLSERYPSGYSSGDSKARVDVAIDPFILATYGGFDIGGQHGVETPPAQKSV